MHVFQHLLLKSSIYSFVKTASEEPPAKLHNYAKYQNLIIRGHIWKLSELLTSPMQSKADVCIYYSLEVLHNYVTATKSLSEAYNHSFFSDPNAAKRSFSLSILNH